MRASILLTVSIVTLSSAAGAQAYLRLGSGQSHEGSIEVSEGQKRLTTAMGSMAIPTATFVEPGNLRAELELIGEAEDGLHKDNAAGHLAVARLAAGRGVWSAARRHLNRVLEIDPDNADALTLARALAHQFAVTPAELGSSPNVNRAVKDWFERGAADWVGAVMVEEKARPLLTGEILHPALKALKSEKSSARWCAARVLSIRRDEPERIKPLFRRGLLDQSAVVRRECVRALKVTNDPVFARLYAINLANGQQALRMTAAEALGELEMPEGAAPLLRALAGDPPVAPRNNIAVTTQTAYVKDFDVQVAQGAVIADPIVDVVQDGTILDVAVVAINIERHVYWGALRRITHQDFGSDLARWRAHLKM